MITWIHIHAAVIQAMKSQGVLGKTVKPTPDMQRLIDLLKNKKP